MVIVMSIRIAHACFDELSIIARLLGDGPEWRWCRRRRLCRWERRGAAVMLPPELHLHLLGTLMRTVVFSEVRDERELLIWDWVI